MVRPSNMAFISNVLVYCTRASLSCKKSKTPQIKTVRFQPWNNNYRTNKEKEWNWSRCTQNIYIYSGRPATTWVIPVGRIYPLPHFRWKCHLALSNDDIILFSLSWSTSFFLKTSAYPSEYPANHVGDRGDCDCAFSIWWWPKACSLCLSNRQCLIRRCVHEVWESR
jgi:hypothetical protein